MLAHLGKISGCASCTSCTGFPALLQRFGISASQGDCGASPRFHKDLAEVPAVPSWLRQPQWKTRSSGPLELR